MSEEMIPSEAMVETESLPQAYAADTQSPEETQQAEGEPAQDGSTDETIEADQDLSEAELQQRLIEEIDQMVARLQALQPDYTPPPFTPKGLLRLIESNLSKFSPEMGPGVLQRLRSSIGGDLLDADTWKGIWYMVNYSLEYQGDILKRRLSGEYETDEWGFDPELLQAVTPFANFLYKVYWRVQVTGLENIADEGRALLVCNHSGQLPWDGAMVGAAIYNEHPSQRLVRTLYASWFPTLPFLSAIFVKLGQVLANEENGIRLLEQDQLVAVYPEGYKGVGKLFKDRYRLTRFGRGGFVRMALKTGAPIIPVSVVGAEETYISLAKSDFIARLIRFPYFPFTPTFPWLGPLGFIPLPTKWYIDFGEPILTEGYGPDSVNNMMLVSQLADQVRNVVQNMIYVRLAQRKSVFFG